MKSKEGLEERLEFLFPDEEERKSVVRSMTNARTLNSGDQPDGLPGLLPDRYGVHPVVEG